VILNLVDDAIEGVDGLPRLLLPLGHGDGVAGNLVLEGAGDLAQGAEGVARVLLDCTPGANGFSACLAVGVDFDANVLLAAGNPLYGGISGTIVVKGDLLVRGSEFSSFVSTRASRPITLLALNTAHGGILLVTSITLDLAARELSLLSAGSDKGVDEGAATKGIHTIG